MSTAVRANRAGWIQSSLAVLLCAHAIDTRAAREVLHYDIDGEKRSVLLYTPSNMGSGSVPLVLVFHGYGDDAAAFADAVKLHRDWPEAIVAYPRGERRPSSSKRGWQYRAGDENDRDVRLVDAFLRDMEARFGVRPDSTFAAGFSNGGQFLFVLMSERPDAFAGFAVIGTVRPNFASDATPRPVLYLFGREEHRSSRDRWAATIEALVRHNRTRGPLADFLTCCKLHSPTPGGAVLAFGLYNAGHIWPFHGNEWLKAFFEQTGSETGRADALP